MGTSVIVTYSNASLSTDSNLSVITPIGSPVTRETITTASFDKFGNALTQSVYKEAWDSTLTTPAYAFSSYQAISGNTYDIHNRLTSSVVDNYSDIAQTFTSREIITTSLYDVYGNSIDQVVNTYTAKATDTTNLVDSKVIHNDYNNVIAESRGNATTSTVSRYTTDITVSQSNSTLIDKTVTNTTSFDSLGDALVQTQDKSVIDSSGSLTPTTHEDITNADYDSRGDAKSQYIATYELDGAKKTLVNYQVFTNRSFDDSKNVVNQMVLTYADPDSLVASYTDPSKGVLLSCQEIRSSNFTPSGVAQNQSIVTYSDSLEKNILSVKVITNSNISSSGDVGTSVIVTYSNASLSTDSNLSVITPIGSPVTRETITTASFDKFGNALTQSVYKEAWDSTLTTPAYAFSSYQAISGNTYDIHNRLTSSVVDNYSDIAQTFTSREIITTSLYDVYGNSIDQVVNTYTAKATDTTNLVDSKVIHNDYNNVIAESRGNATTSTVSRYTTDITVSQSNSTLIDKTVTNTTSFDSLGDALVQTQDKSVIDSSGSLTPTTHEDITNADYDSRGDAKSQYIATYELDGAKKTLVNYQVFTNRSFDDSKNVVNQMVLTYADPDSLVASYTDPSKGVLLSCQEIRSSNFTPSGVAQNQSIVTYSDSLEKNILSVKVITNSNISSSGDVGTSVIVTYSNASLSTDSNLSVITPIGSPVTRETITTASFDKFGNALTQSVYKEAWDSTLTTPAYAFSSYQAISGNTYDIHNRLTSSVVDNYSDIAQTFTSREIITTSLYDVYGNSIDQVVNTYTAKATDTTNLVDSKVIHNDYNNVIAESRGNATTSTVSRYTTDITVSQSNSTLIDKTVTNTTSFDSLGDALVQTQDKSVIDSSGSLTPTTHEDITNADYDSRGDAKSQYIATYELDGAKKTLVNYQVFTNRSFDDSKNVVNQMVLTYADPDSLVASYTDPSKGVLLSCQEIRSSNFTPSGVAQNQSIVNIL